MGFLQVLWLPPTSKDMQVRWIGNSKLSVGVNEFVSVCQPCDRLVTCPGEPCLSPNDCWHRLQHPMTLNRTNGYRKWMDGWMDGWNPHIRCAKCFGLYLWLSSVYVVGLFFLNSLYPREASKGRQINYEIINYQITHAAISLYSAIQTF
ncbi:hypothetical protein LDENG_00116410 [Lucifuga dentata]|nr:hypothetical protein LDENG_00116410 [Lucifuga dentata]